MRSATALLSGLILLAATACETTPDLPKEFLNPANRYTADQGNDLVTDGEAMIEEGEDLIDRGKSLVKEGEQMRKNGEAIVERGEKKLRSAAFSEESERLARKARQLQVDSY